MNANSTFKKHSENRDIPFSSVGKRGLTVFVAAGIVNPFGPTLEVIAADGSLDNEGTYPIFRMSVNPFSQTSETIGEVTVGESWSPFADIAPFLESGLQGCPSLLLPSVYLDNPQAARFYSSYLMQFSGGSELLAKIKRFPQDPWKRVDADVQGATGGMMEKLFRQRQLEEPAKLTVEEATELATIQLTPASLKAELQTFLFAWNGSIEFQGMNPIAEGAMSLQRFAGLLALVSVTCRIPELR